MTREFAVNTSSKSSIIFGACFWVIGIVIMIFLHVYIGALLVILGIIFFFYMRYYGSDTTITCHDTGFSVKVVNKRTGTTLNNFSWEEVTSTKFYARQVGSRNDQQMTSYFFLVQTGEEVAFNLPQMKGFADLIELFNQNTPHLPYYWAKPRGILTEYNKIDRR